MNANTCIGKHHNFYCGVCVFCGLREAFYRSYAERSGVTVAWLRSVKSAVPAGLEGGCDDEEYKGWHMIQFQKVRAIFRPTRKDDLRPGIAEYVGEETTWEALWEIEGGEPYAGSWAMRPDIHEWPHFPAAWVPSCDLELIP